MIKTRRHSARERGAALIVAIGVLTLLLVIALTFFRASLGDMKTAENTVNGVRAELLADGATAVAIGFLNHDRVIHPTYSSTDHAWRTYFNGAWAAGKPWMWAPLQDTNTANGVHRMSLLRGGVPEIDLQNLGVLQLTSNGAPNDGIYIPRTDFMLDAVYGLLPSFAPLNYRTFDLTDPTVLQNPFVTTSDLADPTRPGNFPPFAALYSDPRLSGRAIFPEDLDQLETTVFDAVEENGRVLSLREIILNPTGNPLVTNETLPYEQLHFWNDVDNDGDGLNDSMWLPIGSDREFPEDGLDNDLDGRRDALGADGVDDTGDEDIDGEPGVFLYRGDTDDLDNDGDGLVDEADEFNYVIFTVPRPFMADIDGNGILDNITPTPAEAAAMGITSTDIVLAEGELGLNSGVYETPIGYGRTGNAIFTRDNDYDLVADQPMDASPYMLNAETVNALVNGDAPGCPNDFPCAPYRDLLMNLFGTDGAGLPVFFDPSGQLALVGFIRGETVTSLAGRMAILIKDESSKVNVNATGGWAYPVFPDPSSPPSDGPLLGVETRTVPITAEPSTFITPLQRSFADGIGPFEYDTRVLPQIGAPRARWMWQYLMGAREGIYAQNFTDATTYTLPYFDRNGDLVPDAFEVEGDATLPGYGYVDDNANLLQLALDGINNHGGPTYFIDPDDPIDPVDSFDVVNPDVDQGLFGGKWEGIDEPGEYQRFRPLRDLVAESNGNLDDDGDDILNEIGEIGDQFYRTHQQLKLINAGSNGTFVRGLNDDGVFDDLRNLVTAHSTDRNDRHAHSDNVLGEFTRAVGRQTLGLRKDLNVTRPQDVARAVKREWTYPASVPQRRAVTDLDLRTLDTAGVALTDADFGQAGTLDFLAGLRQENMTVSTAQDIMGLAADDDDFGRPLAFTMLADSELRAHQVATTLKDFADRDYTRSVDDEIFVEDEWWQGLAFDDISSADPVVASAAAIAQTQRIYYTTAGLEAIRINEINVRPVRRFEAEAITDLDAGETNPEDFRGLDPNRFVPHGGVYPPVDQAAAEDIEEEGFRIRVQTTTDAINAFNARETRNLTIVTASSDPEADPVGERWALRPLVPRGDGTPLNDAGLLGLDAAWATYRQYLDVRDPDDALDPDRTFDVPDVVQFSIQATDGLPSGNYYVKISTQYVDDAGNVLPSIGDTDDFLFAVKTGTFEQDWFVDVMNIESYALGSRVYNEAWRQPALIGSDLLGGSDGMAFLQGDAVFRFTDPTLGEDAPIGNPVPYTSTPMDFPENNLHQRNLGFTINVPERDDDPLTFPEDELWLHLAIRSMRPDTRGFVVNFIEFSQEPDHEWIEVTNESDEAVDLSGWQVAVENHPLGLGPMTVPFGTTIAPGGMLLLGTNKFDYAFNLNALTGNPEIPGDISFAGDPDLFDRGVGFFSNGIGLAADDPTVPVAAGVFIGISVPQTFTDPADVQQGSVFLPLRGTNNDFLDTDGNGFDDHFDGLPNLFDDTVFSTIDPALIFPAPLADKAWDRIVELLVPDLIAQTPQSQFTAADVGRIVLAGGIFPNRPEFDVWDNDGDNRVIGFDNIDNNGDGDPDEAFEGFDEGRFARDERTAGVAFPVPGSYNVETTQYLTSFFDFDPAVAGTVPASWDGGALGPNPPQWKEFLERRNFPGDNVLVTLYEGPASDAQVADRITYTQRDIDNRQIDDILQVNDFDTQTLLILTDAGEVPLADPGVPLPLDDRFTSFWPENTMGIDFARSLERKHPSYTGDRFGVQNRFQATDGNYDDWSDSTGRWERGLVFDLDGNLQDVTLFDRLGTIVSDEYRSFAHAIGGTPLRKNVATRYAEEIDPTLIIATDHGVVFDLTTFRNRPLVSPGDALTMPHTSRRQTFLQDINPDVASPGGEGPYMLDLASPNLFLNYLATTSTGRGDAGYDAALFGQLFDDGATPINFFHDVRAFVGDVGTTDSVSLNAGQANVIQVLRGTAGVVTDPDEAWIINDLAFPGIDTAYPPQTWSPLLMFTLTGTASGLDDTAAVPPALYNYNAQYLFQPLSLAPGSLPDTVDTARWPMPLRTALYASRNFDDFDAADPYDGAQAIYVWDGDDGLENGEYDLYVVATEDLSLLARADDEFINSATPGRLLTDTDGLLRAGELNGIGRPFVTATERTANREVYLDVEAFRDSNGDRAAWTDANSDGFITDGDPLTSELHRGQASGIPLESFGVITGARPDADGMIHYGVVRVENNFLAVSLRNRSAAGTIARFSRVILAARNKTPGRININTVESRRITLADPLDPTESDSDPNNFYNPLHGLPGVLARVLDDNGIGNIVADRAVVNPADGFATTLHAQVLARNILEQRLRLIGEQPDGRYYELTSDLLADAHFAEDVDINGVTALRPALVVNDANFLLNDTPQDAAVDFDALRAGAIAEAAYRFRKMQNLITTRGNAYEILVTVQAGYGTDINRDGRINWRDDSEFTATAEKTARTIYER